ncbi:MAG: 50S ribosomal protein L23 [Crocinitomicaceae bacterium]|nr:50S ribosomal protein L23 [Crocinitomicaceae bacterium]|tara:strand:- start:2056 stop:2346 length:291 start_codon:yes stop_codon:yes gene_type:complete
MGILIKPVITEKITSQGEKYNRYAFMVDRNANKLQIKDAIEASYDVTVESVNTMVCGGKRKMRYTKTGIIEGKTKTYKKAVITLSEGDMIDFYSNI